MFEDLRNAVKLLQNCCNNHDCVKCPLNNSVCHYYLIPADYSLERFDENVKELENDE